jgi:hypothetical protein
MYMEALTKLQFTVKKEKKFQLYFFDFWSPGSVSGSECPCNVECGSATLNSDQLTVSIQYQLFMATLF